MKELIGKEVQIYPGDRFFKFGIIKEITDGGVLFQITESGDQRSYPTGKLKFIAYSANLSFVEK